MEVSWPIKKWAHATSVRPEIIILLDVIFI